MKNSFSKRKKKYRVHPGVLVYYAQIAKQQTHRYGVETKAVNQFVMLAAYTINYTISNVQLL